MPSLRGSGPSSSSSQPPAAALGPAADAEAAPEPVPAAEEEQELPVAGEVGVKVREVLIDGVNLDSNSPINTLRGACRSLGLSQGGGKAKLLGRLWEHLQSQELIAAHSAAIWKVIR